jgi:hypothetical protein
MVKFVINYMPNIQTQRKFKNAHQQILFFNCFFSMLLICLLIYRARLHYSGLPRSGEIFIPDSVAIYTSPQQKSLRFGGDMKSNPVCAGAVQTGKRKTENSS